VRTFNWLPAAPYSDFRLYVGCPYGAVSTWAVAIGRKHIPVLAKPKPCARDAPLPLTRKTAGIYVEVAHRREYGVGLGSLVRLTGGGDLPRDIVQKVDGQVEMHGLATLAGRGLARPEQTIQMASGLRRLMS
jgi:hypothetical protein